MIKLVASDMDGTLLNRNGKISPWNIAAIQTLQMNDIKFVACTGRNYQDALAPLNEAGIICDIICMNGAAIFDSRGVKIKKQPLLRSQVSRILDICRSNWPLYDFMTEGGSYTTANPDRLRKSFKDKIFLPMVSEEFDFDSIVSRFQYATEEFLLSSDTDIYKISVVHENQDVLRHLRGLLEQEEELSIASSDSSNLELTHQDAQKGSALLEYAVNAKIRPKEILAIGDSENDLSMLKLPLGYTISMGNAAEIIKKTARIMTRSNDEDGVAFAVESLILSELEAVC